MTVKVPTNGNPLIRELFRSVNAQGLVFQEVCERAGIDPNAVRRWKRHGARLESFEAVLNAMGLELMILPKAMPNVPLTED